MSVVLVRGSELCNRCVLLAHPYQDGTKGVLRVFVESNDLCEDHCNRAHLVVRYARYSDEQGIIKKVEARSPYLRAQRRAQFLKELVRVLLDPFCQLMFITCILCASVLACLVILLYKSGGLL